MSSLDTPLHIDLEEKKQRLLSTCWGRGQLAVGTHWAESFENITEARVTSLNDPLFSLAKKSKRSCFYIYIWVFKEKGDLSSQFSFQTFTCDILLPRRELDVLKVTRLATSQSIKWSLFH